MAEPSVQVPVSLIERAVQELFDAPGREALLVCGELHALLSQPEPEIRHDAFARIMRGAGLDTQRRLLNRLVDRVGRDLDRDVYHATGAETDVRDLRLAVIELLALLSTAPPAEPPRIEDMAPGTTFTARYRLMGAVEDRFTVMPGPPNLWLRGDQYEVGVISDIDPSTIRDVTPPLTESTK